MYTMQVDFRKEVIGNVDGIAANIKNGKYLPFFEDIQPNLPVKADLFLDCFYVKDNAKLIDAFSIGTRFNTTGIIISEKVKNIMENYVLDRTQFIKIEFESKNTLFNDYYLLHIYSNNIENINLSKTFFQRIWPIGEPYEVEEEYGHLSFEKLIILSNELIGNVSLLRPKKYEFKEGTVQTFDLFRIGDFDNAIYISECLKNDLIDNNVVGFVFSKSIYF